jgi:hypothetical protein
MGCSGLAALSFGARRLEGSRVVLRFQGHEAKAAVSCKGRNA